ncbi:hypothetical protein [Lacunimicrobium album]
MERISDDARAFLEIWQDIGELLLSATPEEQLQLLQHSIKVIDRGGNDRETRTGTYTMRLFPEVRPDRGFDFGGGEGTDDPNPCPEMTNGIISKSGNNPACINHGRHGAHNRPERLPG